MKCLFLLSWIFLLASLELTAQNPIPEMGYAFNDTSSTLPKIFIDLPSDSLSVIYQQGNEESDHLFAARFIHEQDGVRDTLEDVGFRFRGNTSRYAFKKSFKVSFNTYVPGREFHGLEKLNLNGEHNDPSIIRSKLCWDLLRELEIPAPRANHVELYVNGIFAGLYINVEHIDEEFVHQRFGNNDGNLYRCLWPADLNFISNNPNSYKLMNGDRRVYELKTNQAADDYSDLSEFIQILNNTTNLTVFRCELERVFNVHDYLKVIAFDILTGNWDGPIYNKNNFYLYKNTFTGKFEYIPFDLDNTIGIDFLNRDWVNRNIYNWAKTNESRPIFSNLMNIPIYRDWFSFYLNQTIENEYNSTDLFPEIDFTKNRITTAAINDTYRTFDYGFTIADFNNSYDNAVGNHIPWGLKEFITDRGISALNQVVLNDISPIITHVKHQVVALNTPIVITAQLTDELQPTALINYRIDGGNWIQTPLFDDGLHQDELANDGIFGGSIPPVGSPAILEYQIEATDQINQSTSYPFCGYQILEIGAEVQLFINEFMAQNTVSTIDDAGDFDDWIEIYNGGTSAVYLGDKYLSDDFTDPTRWQMPDLSLPPNEYVLFWADDEGFEGQNHTNFKLAIAGEELGIFNNAQHGFAPIDTFRYGVQQANETSGRLPNGVGPIISLPSVTPGFSNISVSTHDLNQEVGMEVSPNPTSGQTVFSFSNQLPSRGIVRIQNLDGKLVFEKAISKYSKIIHWKGNSNLGQPVPAGIYYVSILLHESEFLIHPQKIMIIR